MDYNIEAIGEKDNILSAFIPFAKKKKSDFWVWEILSEIFTNDDERKIACLSKALSLKTPEAFLINTRQKMAELLIENKNYSEAKIEIEKLIKSRDESGYKIPDKVKKWTLESWYLSVNSNKDNSDFYSKYIKIADEILYFDMPEEIVAIDFINENKQMLNFVKDKTTHGFLNYSGIKETPKVGDVLKVRMVKIGDDGFYKAYTISKALPNTETDALKRFSGKIKIKEGNNFGFVEDIFVDLNIMKELKDNDECEGIAIRTYNKKKSSWGWKVIKIELKNNEK